MKKVVFFLVIGMLLLSGAVFAQTTQAASNPNQKGMQGTEFAGGGYIGPLLPIIAIGDLVNTVPNEWVIVEGYLIQQRVPGTYVLADSPNNPSVSVIVHFTPYGWANLNITADTPVLIYGTVNRSELRIEIEGVRVDILR